MDAMVAVRESFFVSPTDTEDLRAVNAGVLLETGNTVADGAVFNPGDADSSILTEFDSASAASATLAGAAGSVGEASAAASATFPALSSPRFVALQQVCQTRLFNAPVTAHASVGVLRATAESSPPCSPRLLASRSVLCADASHC